MLTQAKGTHEESMHGSLPNIIVSVPIPSHCNHYANPTILRNCSLVVSGQFLISYYIQLPLIGMREWYPLLVSLDLSGFYHI